MSKKVFILFVLCTIALGMRAATQTINISDALSNLSNSSVYTSDVFTIKLPNGGTAADSKVTLKRGQQLEVSCSSHAITGISFSALTYVDNGNTGVAGSIAANTYNGTFTASGSAGSWANASGWTNEHLVVFTTVGDEAEDAVEVSGSITITYDDADSSEKTTPTITLTPDSYSDIQPGYTKLAEPTVLIQSGSENLTNKYNVNYFIQGQSAETVTTNALGREITTDPVTGSTVERLYGQFEAGEQSAGTVTVVIIATPKTAYATQYEIVQSQYTVNISKITPTASFAYNIPTNGITLNVVQTISKSTYEEKWAFKNSFEKVALPDVALNYTVTGSGSLLNVLDKYDVKVEHLNSDKTTANQLTSTAYTSDIVSALISQRTGKQDSVTVYASAPVGDIQSFGYSSESDALSAAAFTEGTNYIRYTFTPKAAYSGAYETVTTDVPVTVVKKTGEIPLTITLNVDTVSLYKYKADGYSSQHPNKLPVPTLKDAAGNELIVTGNPFTYIYYVIKDSTEYDDCTQDTIQAQVYTGFETYGKLTGIQTYYNPGGTNTIQCDKPGYSTFIVFPVAQSWAESSVAGVFQNFKDSLPTELQNLLTTSGYNYVMAKPETFVVHTMKRAPYVVVMDQEGTELSAIDVHTGDSITFLNQYVIKGRLDNAVSKADVYDSAEEELSFSNDLQAGFWYTFNVPADLMQGENPQMEIIDWPTASQIDTLKYQSGEKAGQDSIYLYHSDYGYNDAYRSWKIKFNADGEYPIGYTIHAWNHVKWDYSSSATKTINFVVTTRKKPVLVIDPKVKFAKTTDGSNFTEPSVKVMYGTQDVTSYYTLNYAIVDSTTIEGGTKGNNTGTQIVAASGEVTVGLKPST